MKKLLLWLKSFKKKEPVEIVKSSDFLNEIQKITEENRERRLSEEIEKIKNEIHKASKSGCSILEYTFYCTYRNEWLKEEICKHFKDLCVEIKYNDEYECFVIKW